MLKHEGLPLEGDPQSFDDDLRGSDPIQVLYYTSITTFPFLCPFST